MSPAEVRQYLQLLVELIKAVAWPAVVVVPVWRFRDALQQALSRSKETFFKFPGGELKLSASEAVDGVSDVFLEVDAILREHLSTKRCAPCAAFI